MKRILLLLTVGTVLASPAFAQSDSTNSPPPGPPPGGHGGPGKHHMDFLTEAQKAEMKKAHDAALQADPNLAAEEKQIHEEMEDAHGSGSKPTPEQMASFKAFRDKMDAAMIKADPDVAPIIEEIKKHHPHGGPGGPPPPPPPAPTE